METIVAFFDRFTWTERADKSNECSVSSVDGQGIPESVQLQLGDLSEDTPALGKPVIDELPCISLEYECAAHQD